MGLVAVPYAVVAVAARPTDRRAVARRRPSRSRRRSPLHGAHRMQPAPAARATDRPAAGRRARCRCCCRSATRPQRVGPCLRSLLAPDRRAATSRSSCSTTARPTAPPTSSAPVAGDDPRVRLLDRRRARPTAGWASRWACHQLAEAAHRRPCSSSSTPTSCSSRTRSPRRSRCCAVPGSTWSRRTRGSSPRRASERLRAAAAAVVVADDAAAAASPSVARDRRSPPPTASCSRSTPPPTAQRAATRPCATRCSRTSRCCARSSAAAAAAASSTAPQLATCRMYDGWAELRDGYTKSLWSAFGSPAGRAPRSARCSASLYVVPPLAAARGAARRAGLSGYAAGVAGRVARGARGSAVGSGPTRSPTRCRSRRSAGSPRTRGGAGGADRSPGRAGGPVSRVVVVGAGMAGLAVAARLAGARPRRHGPRAGPDLRREARRVPAGRVHLRHRPVPADPAGGLSRHCSSRPARRWRSAVELVPVDPACHYRFADGTELDVPERRRARGSHARSTSAFGSGAG